MKIDINTKKNRFTERAFTDFSNAIFELLEKKSFEEITVNALCEVCNYPRSTFYNYFEDIYDLLGYAWSTVRTDIIDQEYESLDDSEHTQYLFHRLYKFMKSNENRINKIMKHNTIDGKMMESLKRYMRIAIQDLMGTCEVVNQFSVPYEIMAEHYSNTIEMVLEWCFLKQEKISEEEANRYIDILLIGLERGGKK